MKNMFFDYEKLRWVLLNDRAYTRPNPTKNTVNSTYRARVRKVLLEEHGPYCWLCDKPLRDETPTLDHIIPRSKGGRNSINNLRLAHKRCNVARGNGPVPELLLTRIAQPPARIEAAWPLPKGERCEAREPETAPSL